MSPYCTKHSPPLPCVHVHPTLLHPPQGRALLHLPPRAALRAHWFEGATTHPVQPGTIFRHRIMRLAVVVPAYRRTPRRSEDVIAPYRSPALESHANTSPRCCSPAGVSVPPPHRRAQGTISNASTSIPWNFSAPATAASSTLACASCSKLWASGHHYAPPPPARPSHARPEAGCVFRSKVVTESGAK